VPISSSKMKISQLFLRFTTHKMRREEGRASIKLPPMADTVADEVDVVMRRDEGGLDGER